MKLIKEKTVKLIKFLSGLALLVITSQAQATATLIGGCSTADLTTSVSCIGVYDPGNDSGINDIFIDADFIAMYGEDWTRIAKVDDPDLGPDGSINLTIPTGQGTTTGTWSVDADAWDGFAQGDVLAVLKAGSNAAAYEIDLDFTSGTWTLTAPAFEQPGWDGSALSHFSIWGREGEAPCDPTTEVCGNTVPEPNMVALLAIGLLGMVAVRRKMKV